MDFVPNHSSNEHEWFMRWKMYFFSVAVTVLLKLLWESVKIFFKNILVGMFRPIILNQRQIFNNKKTTSSPNMRQCTVWCVFAFFVTSFSDQRHERILTPITTFGRTPTAQTLEAFLTTGGGYLHYHLLAISKKNVISKYPKKWL